MAAVSSHIALRGPVKPSSRRLMFALAGAGALLLAAAAIAAGDANALCLAPALALGALLTLQRYPGERILARQVTRRRLPRPRRRAPLVRAVETVSPRGGLLLARSLAVRPPPRIVHATA